MGKIFDIKRFAVHDGPGVRTTVFFKGCPLNCLWCHNPEGISFETELAYLYRRCVACGECVSACPQGLHTLKDGVHTMRREGCTLCMRCANVCLPGALKRYGMEYTVEELLAIVLKDRDFYRESGGGVTCSGGEPLAQADFAAAFLMACKANGLHTAVDTSGYAPWEAFSGVLPYTDLFLYDIKHMNAKIHTELTGVSNEPILANLRALAEYGKAVEVRVPVIPRLNDGKENIDSLGKFLGSISTLTAVRPLPYHALSGSKYAALGKTANMPPADGAEMDRAAHVADRLAEMGLAVIRPDA